MSNFNLQDELLSSSNKYSDPTTEQALLKLLMTKTDSWKSVLELKLAFEHFQTEQHQLLYQAAYAIYLVNNNSENVINTDIITIRNELRNRHSELKAAQLFELATNILANTTITNNAHAYTMILIEKYYLHQIDIAYADREPISVLQALQTEMDSILRPPSTKGKGDFQELRHKEVTETEWIIKDLLPVGVSLMAAKAKTGKTYFFMQAAIAISKGIPFLGQFETTKGRVLQLALEDPEKRLVTRYQQLGDYPKGYWYTLESHFPRIGNGFEETVKKHLDEMQDCKLVIIDTLANVMPTSETKGDTYLKDYQTVTTIKSFANQYPHTAFIFITHMKKGETEDIDSILGSTAISGGFDNLYFLRKAGYNGNATMTMTGKDVAQETHALQFDKQLTAWQYLGTGEMATMSESRKEVISVIQKHGAETKSDIVQLIDDLNDESAKKLLNRMVKDDILEVVGRRGNSYKYCLTEKYQK